MKKVLLAALLLIGGFLYAQENEEIGFKKGDFFISGNVEFLTAEESNNDLNTSSFTILPSIGYLVSNHFALGIQLGYNNTSNDVATNLGTVDISSNTFIAGAFARYYFNPTRKFSFTITGAVRYSNTNSEQIDFLNANTTQDLNINSFGISIAPGIQYFLSRAFAITSSVGLISYGNQSGDIDSSSFIVRLNPSNINFGLLYRF